MGIDLIPLAVQLKLLKFIEITLSFDENPLNIKINAFIHGHVSSEMLTEEISLCYIEFNTVEIQNVYKLKLRNCCSAKLKNLRLKKFDLLKSQQTLFMNTYVNMDSLPLP